MCNLYSPSTKLFFFTASPRLSRGDIPPPPAQPTLHPLLINSQKTSFNPTICLSKPTVFINTGNRGHKFKISYFFFLHFVYVSLNTVYPHKQQSRTKTRLKISSFLSVSFSSIQPTIKNDDRSKGFFFFFFLSVSFSSLQPTIKNENSYKYCFLSISILFLPTTFFYKPSPNLTPKELFFSTLI